VEQCDCRNIGLLADFYHFRCMMGAKTELKIMLDVYPTRWKELRTIAMMSLVIPHVVQ
jgi:hypothetical protein